MIPVLLRFMMLGGAPPAAAAALDAPIGCISVLGFAYHWQLGFDKLASALQVKLPKQRICSCFFELNAPSLQRIPLFQDSCLLATAVSCCSLDIILSQMHCGMLHTPFIVYSLFLCEWLLVGHSFDFSQCRSPAVLLLLLAESRCVREEGFAPAPASHEPWLGAAHRSQLPITSRILRTGNPSSETLMLTLAVYRALMNKLFTASGRCLAVEACRKIHAGQPVPLARLTNHIDV